MSVIVHRRPAAVLALAALLIAGLAAPASASPWSDAWSRLSGWFANTPLGALWAEQGAFVDPNGVPVQAPGDQGMGVDPNGAPRQVVANQGMLIDPDGQPVQAQSDEGILFDPNGTPRP